MASRILTITAVSVAALACGCTSLKDGADVADAGGGLDAGATDAGQDASVVGDAGPCTMASDCPTVPGATVDCVTAECVYTCRDGFEDCDENPDTICESDLGSDRMHCGECTTSCAADFTCDEGACFEPFVAGAAGVSHTCAVRARGEVWCAGSNSAGQLGRLTTPLEELRPADVLVNIVGVSTGRSHSCAVNASGSVYCWGSNANGEIAQPTGTIMNGNPTLIDTSLVPAWGRADRIASGANHTCALLRDGSVTCWGKNDRGQLGHNSRTPPGNAAISGVVAVDVASGGDTSCAVLESGTVRCWGGNTYEQLPGITFDDYAQAIEIPGVTNATQVSVGNGHVCALGMAGTVICWGRNDAGQLGNGVATPTGSPGIVGGLTDAVEVVAAGASTCARRADNSLACWGDNGNGELGNGGGAGSPTPVAVTGGPYGPMLEAISGHLCALSPSGRPHCWGGNGFGQLGDGTTTERSTPTPVVLP